MSSKATKHTSHSHTKSTPRHNVPIVNVFDEDETQAPIQPARRPVVVEIEDVEQTSNVAPVAPNPFPPSEPIYQPQPQVFSAPQPIQPEPVAAAPMQYAQSRPVMQGPTPSVEAPRVMPSMNQEPVLPSFFEQDLKHEVGTQQQMPMQAQPAMQTQAQPALAAMEAAVPQAVVGEINEMSEGGGGSKKMIGIILMVIAVIILVVAGLFLYARNIFSPVTLPTPTPSPIATARPTIPPAPTPSASESGKLASASAELKKKVKVDVLNGTKVVGLAAKQAALVKAAGYTMGTVGNGKPENAGTIVVSPTYKALAEDIAAILKDFTFKIEENAKMTSIQVTLGEQKE